MKLVTVLTQNVLALILKTLTLILWIKFSVTSGENISLYLFHGCEKQQGRLDDNHQPPTIPNLPSVKKFSHFKMGFIELC